MSGVMNWNLLLSGVDCYTLCLIQAKVLKPDSDGVIKA
jgi:hypothetical protein